MNPRSRPLFILLVTSKILEGTMLGYTGFLPFQSNSVFLKITGLERVRTHDPSDGLKVFPFFLPLMSPRF
ncbi:unnamed protein product [Meloidogyne enterolobii]|uniref:Uncharacterized protein n=1 Tax=Meloidogyne enterolobii TaxID=390850 RepID=A0ACB1AGC0_MELEN